LVIRDVEQVADEASRVSTQIIEASRRKISVADTAPQMAEEATKAAALGKKEID
jgi:hypothetical protein